MKRILMAVAISGVLISFMPSTVQAQDPSGPLQNTGEMYDNCKSLDAVRDETRKLGVDDYFKAGRCMGAIEAILVALHFNCKHGVSVRSKALAEASPFAFQQAFMNYARDNPQEWETPSYFGLGQAAEEYFPCKE